MRSSPLGVQREYSTILGKCFVWKNENSLDSIKLMLGRYPDGAIYPLLPQGRWIQFGVASGVSAINLIISVVGAGAFGEMNRCY